MSSKIYTNYDFVFISAKQQSIPESSAVHYHHQSKIFELALTHLMPLISFDTPENVRKPLVFLCFQELSQEISGIKWVQKTNEPTGKFMK